MLSEGCRCTVLGCGNQAVFAKGATFYTWIYLIISRQHQIPLGLGPTTLVPTRTHEARADDVLQEMFGRDILLETLFCIAGRIKIPKQNT